MPSKIISSRSKTNKMCNIDQRNLKYIGLLYLAAAQVFYILQAHIDRYGVGIRDLKG